MKAFSKALVMMAVLTSACLAQAAEGDVKTVPVEKLTGNTLIKSVGTCHVLPKRDYEGKPYIESTVQYTVCEEVVRYTADIVDKGWWKTEEQNVRNVVNSARIVTKSISNSNQFNATNLNSGSQDALTRAVENLGAATLDSMSLKAECETQREALIMQYQNQNRNTALGQACGL